MRNLNNLMFIFASIASLADAQQRGDDHYRVVIAQPAYAGVGPVVAIDEAHRNFHTLTGGYASFGRLLNADGYRVRASGAPFSPDTLKGVDVLVIANAREGETGGLAFSDTEVGAVEAWIEAGGSLLLISDHAPFGTAAAPLARALGVDMGQGYVVVRQGEGMLTSQIEFSGDHLASSPILLGRNDAERVRHVRSFTGQSLSIPTGASGVLILPNDALEVAGPRQVAALRQGQSVQGKRVGGRAQCISFAVGKGRVVVAGEAAMFTSQVVQRPDGSTERVGLTVEDDQRFALNVMHWLSGIL